MRTSRCEAKSLAEIRDEADQTTEDMDRRGTDLEERGAEVESIREAVAEMDFGGTSDAIEIMESALDRAEDVVVETFDQQSDELDDVQAGNAEQGEELHERSEADRGDAERISETSVRISTRESANELTRARDAVLDGLDHLIEQITRRKEAGERSKEHQNTVRELIKSGGRARR